MNPELIRYAVWAALAFVIWKYVIKRFAEKWQGATAQMWTWETFIGVWIWNFLMFGVAGVVFFVLSFHFDIALPIPDPSAPIKSATGRKSG